MFNSGSKISSSGCVGEGSKLHILKNYCLNC